MSIPSWVTDPVQRFRYDVGEFEAKVANLRAQNVSAYPSLSSDYNNLLSRASSIMSGATSILNGISYAESLGQSAYNSLISGFSSAYNSIGSSVSNIESGVSSLVGTAEAEASSLLSSAGSYISTEYHKLFGSYETARRTGRRYPALSGSGLGFIPLVIGGAVIAASLALIVKWTSDYYTFQKKLALVKQLEGQGYQPSAAIALADKLMPSTSILGSLMGSSSVYLLVIALALGAYLIVNRKVNK